MKLNAVALAAGIEPLAVCLPQRGAERACLHERDTLERITDAVTQLIETHGRNLPPRGVESTPYRHRLPPPNSDALGHSTRIMSTYPDQIARQPSLGMGSSTIDGPLSDDRYC
jgi:hypothetical protein